MEATLLGVTAMAFSQVIDPALPVPWSTAEAHAGTVIRRMTRMGWPRDTLVNVNFPNRPPEAVKEIAAVKQGRHKIGDQGRKRGRKMDAEKLAEVLRLHAAWLRGEADGVKADMRWARLIGANLSGADLIRTVLSGANLSGANLIGANLSGADLREANLRGADLREANLSGTNLLRAVGGEVARLDFGGWSICVRADGTSIGCQERANEYWLAWSPEAPEIQQMHADAPAWWAEHGEAVKSVIRCVMAKAERAKNERR